MKEPIFIGQRLRKRIFTVITVILFLLLIIFQVTGNFSFIRYHDPEEILLEEMENAYLDEMALEVKSLGGFTSSVDPEILVINEEYAQSNMEVSAILETLDCMKVKYMCLTRAEVQSQNSLQIPNSIETVIISGDTEGDTLSQSQIEWLNQKGINFIYTSMPKAAGIEKNNLYGLMGIKALNGIIEQVGMRFTDDVFLGGLLEVKDIKYQLEDVELMASCKEYAYGLKVKDEEVVERNEQLPPLLWRNTYGDSKVFVVNGDYFTSNMGYGLLTAMLVSLHGDNYMYPVANMSVMIFDSIPYDGLANEELLQELYSRDSLQFQTDILLPSLISTCRRLDIIPTFYTSSDETLRQMDYFRRSILDLHGELIFSESAQVSARDISIPEGKIWDQYPDIPVIITGFEKSDADILRLYSISSTFGAIIHRVDTAEVIVPETEADNWVNVEKEFSKYIALYLDDFAPLEELTASDASIRFMEYRYMMPTITYEENKILAKIDNMTDQASFVLRTDKEIEEVDGGQYYEIDENAYLIETTNEEFSIQLKNPENDIFQGNFLSVQK
ncbi:DUF2194 domain-containing protein [Eubacteriaceae bacterium ES3]|nr:DUF2194 domain-containing protein [Eubacteriaceae bacterium ES3]